MVRGFVHEIAEFRCVDNLQLVEPTCAHCVLIDQGGVVGELDSVDDALKKIDEKGGLYKAAGE